MKRSWVVKVYPAVMDIKKTPVRKIRSQQMFFTTDQPSEFGARRHILSRCHVEGVFVKAIQPRQVREE